MSIEPEYDEYVPGPHEHPMDNPPVINGVLQPHKYEYGGYEVMGDCGRCGHVKESEIHA